jgi:hypothetical protein
MHQYLAKKVPVFLETEACAAGTYDSNCSFMTWLISDADCSAHDSNAVEDWAIYLYYSLAGYQLLWMRMSTRYAKVS